MTSLRQEKATQLLGSPMTLDPFQPGPKAKPKAKPNQTNVITPIAAVDFAIIITAPEGRHKPA